MAFKKEIQLLKYLNRIETRYVNHKRGDLESNIKSKLKITNEDIGDMHYSEYLVFDRISLGNRSESIISITHIGSIFIENYNYERLKELFYWVFGISALIAAVFAVLTFLISIGIS